MRYLFIFEGEARDQVSLDDPVEVGVVRHGRQRLQPFIELAKVARQQL